jgi:hypothetical protein
MYIYMTRRVTEQRSAVYLGSQMSQEIHNGFQKFLRLLNIKWQKYNFKSDTLTVSPPTTCVMQLYPYINNYPAATKTRGRKLYPTDTSGKYATDTGYETLHFQLFYFHIFGTRNRNTRSVKKYIRNTNRSLMASPCPRPGGHVHLSFWTRELQVYVRKWGSFTEETREFIKNVTTSVTDSCYCSLFSNVSVSRLIPAVGMRAHPSNCPSLRQALLILGLHALPEGDSRWRHSVLADIKRLSYRRACDNIKMCMYTARNTRDRGFRPLVCVCVLHFHLLNQLCSFHKIWCDHYAVADNPEP